MTATQVQGKQGRSAGTRTWRDYVGPVAAPALVVGLVAWLLVLLWLFLLGTHAALDLLAEIAVRH